MMQSESWVLVASAAVFAGFAAFALFAASSLYLGRRAQSAARRKLDRPEAQRQSRTAFLFDDESLVDATPAARQLLSLAQRGGSGWTRLMQVLRGRFPQVEERLSELLDRGSVSIASEDGRSLLKAEWFEGLARIQLSDLDADGTGAASQVDPLALRAMEDELELFRSISAEFPYPSWIETGEGRITWANRAYLLLSDDRGPDGGFPGWPPARVFPTLGAGKTERTSLPRSGGKPAWYEVGDIALATSRLGVAVPADHIVAAETSRIEFLQTLTKTFASLSMGLAVFDRNRRLILFNPALCELTGIGAEVLIQRPSFDSFAERLRDARILPEPRDFSSWKQRILRTVSEAEQGTLAESWSLADGRTYDIQGRPLPDGAIAFMVQDVSDGMRLTRQFRSDLTLHLDVLDHLVEPLIVFNHDGSLFAGNAAYRRLWGEAAEAPIAEAKAVWRGLCEEAAHWDVTGTFGEAGRYEGVMADGQQVQLDLLPLPGGAVMARFRTEASRPIRVAAE